MQPVMRREGGGGGDREGGAGSLWEGQYDEKASARSFQEALQEWRAGRSGLLSFMCKILSVRDKSCIGWESNPDLLLGTQQC